MARTLASIQKIIDIQPIEGADKIEVATVLGWHVVVKKDEFKVGDSIIYIEVDSIVPAIPEFEFLKDRKYRVKTIKLRGQISQGLIVPLSMLPKNWMFERNFIGQDVTDALGIIKYDPQEDEEKELMTKSVGHMTKFFRRFKWYRNLFMVKKEGGFPSWITKTDETRIQNFPNICVDERGTLLEVTEKLDGQSATYFLKRGKFGRFTFGVCSRKIHLPKPDASNYWKIAKQDNIESALKRLIGNHDSVVLQGEIIGEGIQGNKYGIKGHRFYAFNLIVDGKQIDTQTMRRILYTVSLDTVPMLESSWLLPKTIDEAVKFATGVSVVNGKSWREGVVCRNVAKSLSFKIINPQFLLKNE